MKKTVVKALEGFEALFDEVSAMKEKLEAEKQEAINAAIAEVENKFVQKSQKIDEVLEKVSISEEIEVEDEESAIDEQEVGADNVVEQPQQETLY